MRGEAQAAPLQRASTRPISRDPVSSVVVVYSVPHDQIKDDKSDHD